MLERQRSAIFTDQRNLRCQLDDVALARDVIDRGRPRLIGYRHS